MKVKSTNCSGFAVFALGSLSPMSSRTVFSPSRLGYCFLESSASVRISPASFQDAALDAASHIFSQRLNGGFLIGPDSGHGLHMRSNVSLDRVGMLSYESARGHRAGVLKNQPHLGHVGKNN